MSNRDVVQQLVPGLTGRQLEYGRGPITAIDTTNKLLTVKLNGSNSTIGGIRYYKWYSPTVGDVVDLLIDGPDTICLGPLA